MAYNKLTDEEHQIIQNIKMLAEAYKLYPTYYCLSTMQDCVRRLQYLYVSKIQDDFKSE